VVRWFCPLETPRVPLVELFISLPALELLVVLSTSEVVLVLSLEGRCLWRVAAVL
jgi:hypothetical protein